MLPQVLAKERLGEWVADLRRDRRVVGPVPRENKFVFSEVDSADELAMDYPISVLGPKKYFLPQYETLLKFNRGDASATEAPRPAEPTVILGAHPCDITSTWLLDKVFSDRNKDPYYLSKRDRALMIGLDCAKPCDECQFCLDMGSLYPTRGYDLFCQDLGDRYFVQIGTEAGEELIGRCGCFTPAGKDDLLAHERFERSKRDRFERRLPGDGRELPGVLGESYDSLIWGAVSRRCFSCGSCNLVCPTCYCFNVADELEMDLSSGQRRRSWDACQLRNFAEVAGGENFREQAAERLRHRVFRKGKYMFEQFGELGCVGCGRCDRNCVAEISIREMFGQLFEQKQSADRAVGAVAPVSAGDYLPRVGRVVEARMFTEREKWFRIELADGLGLHYRAGQFVEASLFGIGEAPISICTAPDEGGGLELCIRAVGDLTNALHRLEPGGAMGIRGPFGNGYDMAGAYGDDVLFVAGGLGLAPCRSFIQAALADREQFGRMTVLYGARTPAEMLFTDDLVAWARRDDCELLVTVDRPDGQWVGHVGVITTLFKRIEIDPARTTVFIIGPPVMFKYAVMELLAIGLPEAKILCSLERRMKCGLGKCGHCQIRNVYVCQDGPVFSYAQVKRLREGI